LPFVFEEKGTWLAERIKYSKMAASVVGYPDRTVFSGWSFLFIVCFSYI
jgi:hypothetical protein